MSLNDKRFPAFITAGDGGRARLVSRHLNVRLGSLADIRERVRDVRFGPESGPASIGANVR